MRFVIPVLILVTGVTAFGQLPCTRAEPNDPQPWVHKLKVFDSFPKSAHPPVFIGEFRDKDWNYQVELYKDENGIFGEILSPVLQADSPVSRLYAVTFDEKTGNMTFETRFPMFPFTFAGQLKGRKIIGKVAGPKYSKNVILKKIKPIANIDYVSRAQYECSSYMNRRY